MDEIKWPKNDSTNTKFIFFHNSTTDADSKSQEKNISIDSLNNINLTTKLQQNVNFGIKNTKVENEANTKFDNSVLENKPKIQQIVENTISETAHLQIHHILELVSALSSPEKLLLYMRLPTDSVSAVTDPLRQPLNPLGSRTEISQTINWIRTHLEEDPELSLPKQDVYEEYTGYCLNNGMKALSTADFGKVMKQVYPRVRPRRLGTRGNSRYCYAGLRKRIKLEAPQLPDVTDTPKSTEPTCSQADLTVAASCLVREWAENLLGIQFPTLCSLACYLLDALAVDTRSVAAVTLLNSVGRHTVEKDHLVSVSTNTHNSVSTNKHRETQLQLQRKLHQRGVIKEQKRKLQLQSPKCEQRQQQRGKKPKLGQTTPSVSDEEECLSSGSFSPQRLSFRQNQVCDSKRVVSSPAPSKMTLPDFSSFQNSSQNDFTQQNEIIHDYSNKKSCFPAKNVQKNEKDKNRVNFQQHTEISSAVVKKSPTHKQISVKSFANKSISRSNSYERKSDPIASVDILDGSIINLDVQNTSIDGAINSHVFNIDEKVKTLNYEKHNFEQNNISQNTCTDIHLSPVITANISNTESNSTVISVLQKSKPTHLEPTSEIITDQKSNEKIALPRLPCLTRTKQSTMAISPTTIIVPPNPMSIMSSKQKSKYKAIQPKPICDKPLGTNMVENKMAPDTNFRSQDKVIFNNSKIYGPDTATASDNTYEGELLKVDERQQTTTEWLKPTLKEINIDNSVNQANLNRETGIKTTNKCDCTAASQFIDDKIPVPDLIPLTDTQKDIPHRERVISIGNIDKDALDDYLYGGNNSQEHEEEIMQYFHTDSSSIEDFKFQPEKLIESTPEGNYEKLKTKELKTDGVNEDHGEKCDKISQLRLLLQKNLKSNQKDHFEKPDSKNFIFDQNRTTFNKSVHNVEKSVHNVENIPAKSSSVSLSTYFLHRQQNYTSAMKPNSILPSLLTSNSGLNTRRRVSFDTHGCDNVPPSPNTRRKHFSFTPISPGPHSPIGGRQSKCSSTNASPFVSPRSTPVPRNRNNCATNSNGSISRKNKAVCVKTDSINEIVNSNNYYTPPVQTEAIDGNIVSGHFVVPTENQNFPIRKHNFPMSAPPSPIVPYHRQKSHPQQTNYLQTLLDADSKLSRTPSYGSSINEYIDKKLKTATINSTNVENGLKSSLETLKVDVMGLSSQDICSSSKNISPKLRNKRKETGLKLDTKLDLPPSIRSADPLSQEVSQFFSEDVTSNLIVNNSESSLYRSQSVPLHQMKNILSPICISNCYNQTAFNFNFVPGSTCSSVGQTPVPNEFSDFGTSFNENNILNNEHLNKIWNILENETNRTETSDFSTGQNCFINISSSDVAASILPVNNLVPDALSSSPGLLSSFSELKTNQSVVSQDSTKMAVTSFENELSDSVEINLESKMIENNTAIDKQIHIDSADMIGKTNYRSIPVNNKNISNLLIRSQSIDFSETTAQNLKLVNQPSRSVPSTPLPYGYGERTVLFGSNEFSNETASKSYPSTPLTDEIAYKTIQTMITSSDYLLNGQPVVSKCNEDVLNYQEVSGTSSETKVNILEENYVDDTFTFNELNDSVLLDTSEPFNFGRDTNEQDSIGFNETLMSSNDELMQLTGENEDNFAANVGANDQQRQVFLNIKSDLR